MSLRRLARGRFSPCRAWPAVVVAVSGTPWLAAAQTAAAAAPDSPTVATAAQPDPAKTAPPAKVVATFDDPGRPIQKPLKLRNGFAIDPVADGAAVGVSLGFGALSQVVLTTGEIVPQQPQDSHKLLGIDKIALHQNSTSAGPLSNVGLLASIAFAIGDSVATGFRQDKKAMLADFVIYTETLSISLATTNLAKLTVRRPRPSAYQKQEQLNAQYGKDNAPSITDTDSGMSFYSGHTALVASVASTATYLAFVRAPKGSPRPWITLGVGAAMTAFVGVERVRAGAHFPTDVIAAAMAGIGIGLLVPHLHRFDESKARSVWVGAAPERGGASLALSGTF